MFRCCIVFQHTGQEFHDDLYPDTVGTTPAMSAEAWWKGGNKQVRELHSQHASKNSLILMSVLFFILHLFEIQLSMMYKYVLVKGIFSIYSYVLFCYYYLSNSCIFPVWDRLTFYLFTFRLSSGGESQPQPRQTAQTKSSTRKTGGSKADQWGEQGGRHFCIYYNVLHSFHSLFFRNNGIYR